MSSIPVQPSTSQERTRVQRPGGISLLISKNGRVLLAFIILAVLLIAYITRVPQFGAREQRSIVNQGIALATASFGQLVVILTGGIDLSVGAIIGLTNSVASRITTDTSIGRVWLAGGACLLIGALCGFINGVIVAYGRLQPIIVTLATTSVYTGLALYVRPTPAGKFPFDATQFWTGSMSFGQLPLGIFWLITLTVILLVFRLQPIIIGLATISIFTGLAIHAEHTPGGKSMFDPTRFGIDSINGGQLPRGILWLIALVVIWLIFRRTRLATSIISIGSSEGAAFMSGVSVNRAKIAAYTISGLTAGAAGFYLTAQTGNGNAATGQIYMLNTIAAVVLGGASLLGGSGTYLGTVAGAYIIALIPRVLFFYNVSQFYQELLQGFVLIAAVALGAVGVLRARNRLDKV